MHVNGSTRDRMPRGGEEILRRFDRRGSDHRSLAERDKQRNGHEDGGGGAHRTTAVLHCGRQPHGQIDGQEQHRKDPDAVVFPDRLERRQHEEREGCQMRRQRVPIAGINRAERDEAEKDGQAGAGGGEVAGKRIFRHRRRSKLNAPVQQQCCRT